MSNTDSITIAIMGPTGSGKSTLINLLSDTKVKVGYGLESCTSEVEVASPFLLDGKVVTLIDTPGFDDTVKTEAEILRLITDFLSATYKQGRTLNGLIFLQRISDTRVGGVARKNFRLFRKLCGDETLKNVLIVTNMWDEVDPAIGAARERELAEKDVFFRPALEKGARMVRHQNTVESAHSIVREIIGFPAVPLQIQLETVDEHKKLVDTDVGQDVKTELDKAEAKHLNELDGLRSTVQELLAENAAKHHEEIQELRDSMGGLQGQLAKVRAQAEQLLEENEISRREHEEKMRLMAEAMAERETELRTLQERTREQNKRLEHMTTVLEDAERRASEESTLAAKAHEDLKASNEAYQAEIERMRKDFDEKLKTAKREAAAAAPPPPPPVDHRPTMPQRTTAQEHWQKAYASTQARSSFFGALTVMWDQIFGSR